MRFDFLAVLIFIFIGFFANTSLAQEVMNTDVQMADEFRKEGKIYVVIAVVVVLFVGLLLYALNLDKKVSRLEKEVEK